jgi:hypothetical protein
MKYSMQAPAFVLALAAAGCSAAGSSDAIEGAVGSTSQAVSTALPLISPATCTTRNNYLVSCKVGPATLTGVPFMTAVPLRTTFTVNKAGNCSTQYPLQVTAKADDGSSVVIDYLSASGATLRRSDGKAMTSVSVTDSSPWTSVAAFSSSCRDGLTVAMNQVDVDTVAQAQALLTKLQQKLASDQVLAENYDNLMLFEQAYQFMKAVAQNFYAQLTNPTIQQLRDAASTSNAALVTLITSCDAGLSQSDKLNLLQLYSSLSVLGPSSNWTNSDGGVMTLAEYIGPTAQSVLSTVDGIIASHDADAGGTSYATLYQQAEQAVVQDQAQLALGQQQLSPWLATDGGPADGAVQ